MTHRVQTTHIQRLIANGATLAENAHGRLAGHRNTADDVGVEAQLEKAAADLRHAAEELTAERLSCLGFEQV